MIVTNVGGLPSLVPDGKVGLVAEPNAAKHRRKNFRIILHWEKNYFLPHLARRKEKI